MNYPPPFYLPQLKIWLKGKSVQILEYLRFRFRDIKFRFGSFGLRKSVFCRPRGGLADSFAQISKCLIYAQAHQRTLYVDAVNSGQLRSLNDYFLIHSSSTRSIQFVTGLNSCLPQGNRLTIFPELPTLDVDSFFSVYDQGSGAHIDPQTRLVITFDFNKSYPHDVLFHEQCGSGGSWNVFERLVLAPNAKKEILERLSRLPSRFNAIHIRNTDLKTAYVDQLVRLRPKLVSSALPVLLCSDSPSVLKHVQNLLQGIQVFSIYSFPNELLAEEDHTSLHYNSSTRGWLGDIGLMSDLIALALSEQLFILRLDNGFFSGFSLLAQDLHRRPWILNRLFGSQVDVLRKQ